MLASDILIRYRTGSPYPGNVLVLASAFCSLWYLSDRMPDSLEFLENDEGGKVYNILHVQTAGGGKGYNLHVYTRMLLMLYLICDVDNKS